MANIVGNSGNNNLVGTNFNDVILGFGGNDRLRGRRGNDKLDGGDGNDRLIGGNGNDTLIGSAGNDRLNGGRGIDTVDYSELGQKVTLQALGVIDKGSLGQDRLIGLGANQLIPSVEIIIGAEGQNNTIDGTLPAGANGFFNIDLAANSFQIGGLGNNLKFDVINFSDVIGTLNDDTIAGDNGNNTFFGSAGNDVLSGGNGGFDTVDYSDLGQKITLKALGEIEKGSLGQDQIVGLNGGLTPSIDKIIGAEGEDNTIDGSPVDGFTNGASFEIDLAEDSLTIEGLGASLDFEVVDFIDLIGTNNDDILEGDSKSNSIFGGGGEDRLVGVDDLGATPGRGEVDVLSGGTGADSFILGDDNTSYYLGDGSTPFGLSDFAFVPDFQFGVDEFIVSDTSDYILNFVPGENIDIFADINDDGVLDRNDDLVAKLSLSQPISTSITTGITKQIDNSLDSITAKSFDQLIDSQSFNPVIGVDNLEIPSNAIEF